MLTIFAIPKSFDDPKIGIIQKNAIRSWKKICPSCQIILMGDEPGVFDIAKELNIEHIDSIKKNNNGTPLLSSAFNMARELSKNNILVYVNCDIIFTSDLIDSIKSIKLSNYLIAGRRIDLDVKEEINFLNVNWESKILEKTKNEGVLHGFSGIDYFVFPKEFNHNLPDFTVGRIGWDNSFLYQAKIKRIPIIDATYSITAIHQNHFHFQKTKEFYNSEKDINFKLAGGLSNMLTLREADYILNKEGLKSVPFPRVIFSKLALFFPWRVFLSIKRNIMGKILKK